MGIAERYPVRYSVEDYEKWEGDWELVEGIPYALGSPSPKHQAVGARLVRELSLEVEEKCPGCFVLYETDWYVSSDTVVRPDIAVVCGKLEERLRRTPLLIVEIVSPGSERQDEGLKFELYQREGVRNYLLIYPEERTYKYYVLTDKGYIRKEGLFIDLGKCTITLNMDKIWI